MSTCQKEINYQLSSPYPLHSRKVKTLMAKQGKRNKELIEATGILPSYVSKHIHGRARNPVVQQAIADFLNVSLDSILDKSQKPKGSKAKRKSRPSTAQSESGSPTALAASSQSSPDQSVNT